MDFFYDEASQAIGFKYNSTEYWYIRNAQGDIIGIINNAGAQVVTYTYDAYGNPISTTGSLASTVGASNPYRYRGYYFDAETGFYYCNSRYYDPANGRWINADGMIEAGFLLPNMFMYCYNNPVNISIQNHPIASSADATEKATVPNYTTLEIQQSVMSSFGNSASSAAQAAVSNSSSSSINFTFTFTISITFRNVTQEVNRALAPYVTLGQELARLANASPAHEVYRYGIFAGLVFHNGPWDIKRDGSWMSTIGTSFPSAGTVLIYRGIFMSPETLGNFTYGYLGAAFGISLQDLITGSVFAAYINGSITIPGGFQNEFQDWDNIRLGYLMYYS